MAEWTTSPAIRDREQEVIEVRKQAKKRVPLPEDMQARVRRELELQRSMSEEEFTEVAIEAAMRHRKQIGKSYAPASVLLTRVSEQFVSLTMRDGMSLRYFKHELAEQGSKADPK